MNSDSCSSSVSWWRITRGMRPAPASVSLQKRRTTLAGVFERRPSDTEDRNASLDVPVGDAFNQRAHGGLPGVGGEEVHWPFVAEGGSWLPQPLFGR